VELGVQLTGQGIAKQLILGVAALDPAYFCAPHVLFLAAIRGVFERATKWQLQPPGLTTQKPSAPKLEKRPLIQPY
jgi:hypothetical protein